MGMEQGLGHHQAQHGVPEKLQPLVGGHATVLVGVRAVRQRQPKQVAVQSDAEGVTEYGVWGVRYRQRFWLVIRPSDRDDLPSVVLSAVVAGQVWRLRLAAGAVGTRRESGRRSLPLRAARVGVASRLSPLRNGHCKHS